MDIATIIDDHVKLLAVWLSETHNVDSDEVTQKWSEITGIIENKVNNHPKKSTKSSSKVSKVSKIKKTCTHVFLSGQKVGEQCLVKPKENALYCSSHRPKDEKSDVTELNGKIDHNFESDKEDEDLSHLETTTVAKKKKTTSSRHSKSSKHGKTSPKDTVPEYDTENEPLDENLILKDD
jgi:hypothetical protein